MPLRWPRLILDCARQPVLIAGSGRSGSTWLAELLNVRGDHRVIWEPLNEEQVPLARVIGARRYLRASDDAPAERAAFARILTGRTGGAWIDTFNRPGVYRRRLVKIIRGNLMLGWVRATFPHVPIVFLMRHPGAVIASWARQGWRQSLSAEPMLAQPALVEAHGLHAWCSRPRDAMADMLLAWCIENAVPLHEVGLGGMCIVRYEDLKADPAGQLQRICDWIGRPLDPRMLARIDQPSALTGEHSPLTRGEDPATAWQRELDAHTCRLIDEHLARFGLGAYYSETLRSSLPA